MTKEELIKLGLTEEQAEKILGSYVPKTQLDEKNAEIEALKVSIAELKNSIGEGETLTQQMAQLKTQNAEQQKAHENEMNQLRLDNAINNALLEAGAKNAKAVRAMLNDKAISIGDDGKISGLAEQITALQKSDAYMFHDKSTKFQSYKPGVGVDILKPGYLEKLEEKEAIRRAFDLPSAAMKKG